MKKTYIIISLFTVIIFVVILYKQSTSNYSPKTKLLQTDEKYNRGKQVYEKNCVSCHDKKMTEYATAPPLGWITKLRDKKWLYNYTRNSMKMFNEKDLIAVKLRSQNFGLMPNFQMLNNEDLDATYYYIEKEFEKNKINKKKGLENF